MAAAHRRYGRRGHVTLDWALIVVGLMAVAVLAGTVIRTGAPGASAQFGAQVGGLRALSETETLLLFEDMTSQQTGWSGGVRNGDYPGLGAIWLAEPSDEPLRRSIALPEGTVRAVLSFDLVAIDDWRLEGLAVTVDGIEVLRQRFTSHPDQGMAAIETPARSDRIAVRAGLEAPRELGFASGAPELAEQVLHVDLAIFTSADTLELTFTSLPAETARATTPPRWAIDNLVTVAERLP